ncbi:MAG TPA: ATP-grasp domain-containing protein [Jatrophihabitans sp.]|nr:ATP-grasp domain-containing protein [Jatrophihabitans sp.]
MHVLLVGGNREAHRPFFRHGHDLTFINRRGWFQPADLASGYRQLLAVADDAPLDLWAELAGAMHRTTPFDVVVSVHDNGFAEAAELGRRLGVPCHVDAELSRLVLDKSRTRDVLAAAGVESCRHRVVKEPAALAEAADEIGYPCIVKPVDSAGSIGVARIDSPADVAAAGLRAGQTDRELIVEEFLAGAEFSVEAISAGRRHHILAITRKFKKNGTFVEQGHLVPADLPEDDRRSIEQYVVRVLDALGFHDCPSHTEVILTDAGPRLVETHNRLGGDQIVDLVGLVTGVDLYDLVARQSLGEDIAALLSAQSGAEAFHAERHAAVWFADPDVPVDLHLTEIAGLDAARALPGVVEVQTTVSPGPGHGEVRNSLHRSAWAVALADTADAALAAARQAVDTLRLSYVWRRPAD